VTLQDGAPVRALLVRGRSLAEGGRTLLAVDGGADAVEADGLGTESVSVTGVVKGAITVWAPQARRVVLNGREVALQREGEAIRVTAEGTPALAGDPSTAPSSPRVGDIVAPATEKAADAAAVGPASGTATPVEAHGGCSGGGEASALALLGLIAATARLIRRRQRRGGPPPGDGGGGVDLDRAA
jgi:hypothetical protein